jgi:hypothetical protein
MKILLAALLGAITLFADLVSPWFSGLVVCAQCATPRLRRKVSRVSSSD